MKVCGLIHWATRKQKIKQGKLIKLELPTPDLSAGIIYYEVKHNLTKLGVLHCTVRNSSWGNSAVSHHFIERGLCVRQGTSVVYCRDAVQPDNLIYLCLDLSLDVLMFGHKCQSPVKGIDRSLNSSWLFEDKMKAIKQSHSVCAVVHSVCYNCKLLSTKSMEGINLSFSTGMLHLLENTVNWNITLAEIRWNNIQTLKVGVFSL